MVISYLADNIGRTCRFPTIFLVSTILSIYCSYLEYVKLYQLELMLKILIANSG